MISPNKLATMTFPSGENSTVVAPNLLVLLIEFQSQTLLHMAECYILAQVYPKYGAQITRVSLDGACFQRLVACRGPNGWKLLAEAQCILGAEDPELLSLGR